MIVVFGSINVDLVARVDRLPGPGETVKGPGYDVFPGGKGANQALAARRAGAAVAMVGAVGADGFRDKGLELLVADGVDVADVATVDAPTGIAMIAVDRAAENMIVVASGANRLARPEAVGRRIGAADTLLLQFECPEPALREAARAASARGARIVLNAAPAGPVDEELGRLVDVLVVNEHEAAEVARGIGLPDEPFAFARAFAKRSGGAVVVTLGAEGAYAVEGDLEIRLPSPRVSVVDTTAAGDAFVGALAAALDRGAGIAEAVADGVAAGSLAVERLGAQPSLPDADAIRTRAATLPRAI
ncbi:ribokinase [Oharaeibacter diazotrophicus]|uniref:Ribokinase n=2 Tax=Oharaeibacter diazotrophicus TaxID=1920512 RepID=A0A4R6REQ1_9HYPH|nr:ribokinase [Oharaeibacter diazotrophicus]TDP84146.1 ribokinase [Oharaeibacter diazotrophicus]GLS74973.1 ribokinase [Oharaeibacter diazotrophicus]